jgi:hypothetical protein
MEWYLLTYLPQNEHICATALYYYDSVNITPSHLGFMQQSDSSIGSELDYPQDQHEWFQEEFGLQNDDSAIQYVGSIEAREGRLLTWPNILEHRVQHFMLADPTKPGHRKILALFLVDPNIPVISTANVPCQRKDWWVEAVKSDRACLTVEIQHEILSWVNDYPMDMVHAKELRLELIEERRVIVAATQGATFACPTFSLCEH